MPLPPDDEAALIAWLERAQLLFRGVSDPGEVRRATADHLAALRADLAARGWAADRVAAAVAAHRTDLDRIATGDLGDRLGAANTLPEEGGLVADRYRLDRLLEHGQGGAGRVYRGTDLADGTPVAAKIVPADAEPDAADRAARLLDLRHPHLVPVLAAGALPNGLGRYLIMPLVPGGTLADYLAGRDADRPPLEAVAQWTRQLAAGLAYFHDRAGGVHRDLKPLNVLLTSPADDADVVVVDLDGSQPPAPRSGTPTHYGTDLYRSPEQVARHRRVTPATDVYAAGVILYELLTGDPPFARRRDRDHAVRCERPAPPDEAARPGWLPADDAGRLQFDRLAAVCLACLRKRPECRYASAADLAADLARVEAGLDPRGVPLRWWGRRRAWSPLPAESRRVSRGRAAAVAGLVVTLLATAGWLGHVFTPRAAAPDPPEAASEPRPEPPDEFAATRSAWALLEPVRFEDPNAAIPPETFDRLDALAAECEGWVAARPADRHAAGVLGHARLRQAAARLHPKNPRRAADPGERTSRALAAAEAAREVFARAAPDEADHRDGLAHSWRAIALLRWTRGDLEGAEAAARQAVAHRTRLVVGLPGRPEAAVYRLYDRVVEVNILFERGRPDEAVGRMEEAADELDQVPAVPDQHLLHRLLAYVFLVVGTHNEAQRRPADADRRYRRSLDEADRASREFLFRELSAPPESDAPDPGPRSPSDLVQLLGLARPWVTPERFAARSEFFRRQAGDGGNAAGRREATYLLARSLAQQGFQWRVSQTPAFVDRAGDLFAEFDRLAQELAAGGLSVRERVGLVDPYVVLTYTSLKGAEPPDETWLRRATELVDRLEADQAATEEYRLVRSFAYFVRGAHLARRAGDRGDPDLALAAAAALAKAAEGGRIAAAQVRRFYVQAEDVLIDRMVGRLRAGGVAAARDLADRVRAEFRIGALLPSGELCYNLACVYARAAAVAPAADRDGTGATAVALLRRAFTAGFGGVAGRRHGFPGKTPYEHMTADHDLDAVRGRADYRAFDAAVRAEAR